MALGLGLSLGLLALVGFDAKAVEHTASQLLSLRILYILGPVALYMTAFVIAWRYPLTAERQERIHRRVRQRQKRSQARESATAHAAHASRSHAQIEAQHGKAVDSEFLYDTGTCTVRRIHPMKYAEFGIY